MMVSLQGFNHSFKVLILSCTYLFSPVPVLLVQMDDDGEEGVLRINLYSTNSERLFPKNWEIS